MIKILKYLNWKQWLMILASLVLIVGQVWLDLTLPDYMNQITTLVQTPGSVMGDIWIAGGKMLACALGSALMAVVTGFLVARVAAAHSKTVRSKVFSKVQGFSNNEIRKFSTASLITRSTNDVTQIQTFITLGLQILIKAPILAVWAIIKILGKSWQWSIATAAAVVFLAIVVVVLIVLVLPKFKKIQTQTDNLNKVTRENLTGLRVVRAYNAEDYEGQKFEKANEELTSTNLFTSRMMALMSPVMNIVMSGLTLAIYWIGSSLILNVDVTLKLSVFSDMVVFSSYAMQVVMAFIMLIMVFIMLPRAAVSARRINEVLNTKNSIIDGSFDKDTELSGVVEFKQVGFKYPDAEEYVLKNINFKANKGQTVAFIGSTGSGKSTLINLVPRFYDATEGEVLIDGVNVKDFKVEELNNRLGYISQKAVLFSGTIKSNILLGENGKEQPDEKEIKSALSIAQAANFVARNEKGLDGEISQGGKNVSGGQKQRLSIARAIARKPEIFIFDDSFSALDYKTDKKLREAIDKNLKDSTCLIVAQRIGTIKNADKIIVLENGQIVGEGTHKQLLKNCKVYKEIAFSQLSKEELANG